MKHFHKLLPAIFALFLASCSSGNGVVGTYKFQLGPDKGTHMGLYMELTDKDYTEKTETETKVLGKTFELTADLNGVLPSSEPETPSNQSGDSQASDPDDLQDQDFTLKGYYNLGTGEEEGRLLLGTTVLDGWFSIASGIVVPSDLVDKILYATIDSNAITVVIPVSQNDLLYQLYWYGYRVQIQGEFKFEELTDKHPVGNHPTEEEIKAIQASEKARGETNNMFEDFRDYHTLSMGLVK